MDQLTIIDYLVGYQLIAEIEPSLQPIFNNDYSAIRLVVGTSNLTNEEILGFASRIDSWATENVSDEFKITRGDNTILSEDKFCFDHRINAGFCDEFRFDN